MPLLEFPTITLAAFIRLAVAPIIAFSLANLLGLTGPTLQACIVEASMPTAQEGRRDKGNPKLDRRDRLRELACCDHAPQAQARTRQQGER